MHCENQDHMSDCARSAVVSAARLSRVPCESCGVAPVLEGQKYCDPCCADITAWLHYEEAQYQRMCEERVMQVVDGATTDDDYETESLYAGCSVCGIMLLDSEKSELCEDHMRDYQKRNGLTVTRSIPN